MRGLLNFVLVYCFLLLCPLGMKGNLNAFREHVSLIRLHLTLMSNNWKAQSVPFPGFVAGSAYKQKLSIGPGAGNDRLSKN